MAHSRSGLRTRAVEEGPGNHCSMNLTLKGVVLCCAILLLVVAFLIGSQIALARFQSRTGSRSSSRVKSVDELFRKNCARCHGAEGRGDTQLGKLYNSPDFTDENWWQKHSKITSQKSLVSIVVRGKGTMPAFGKKLSRAQIVQLVNYLRHFPNKPGQL